MNSKKVKNTRFLHSLSVFAGIGLLTVSAMAEDCYHIVDLGVLGFTPGIEDVFGINNANQAVFTAMVGGKKHAMLYLPAPAYNLTAGVHDLHTLAGPAIGDASAAHDINSAGIVVGSTTVGLFKHAFVWRLDTDPFEFIDLGTFATGDSSVAYAINNDTPFPIVVGDGNLLFDCGCADEPPPWSDEVRRAFALELKDPPDDLDMVALLDQDPGLSCHPGTWARDVKSPAGLTVAGFSTVGTADCPVPEGCGAGNAATAWIDPAPGSNPGDALALLPPDHHPPYSGGTQARGVSDTGALVGYGYTAASSPCKQHAVYWDTDIVVEPLDLGKATGIDGSSQSVALRINNNESPETLQAVGYQLASPDLAFLWECDGNCDVLANWSATELDGTILHCSDFWSIRQAHDVNDDGWIVAWANANPGGPAEYHAVILFPEEDCEVCCFADLDCSGNVGASDLLAILAAWGPCLGCVADLDCDGVVGASDLLLLLAVWDECQMTAPSEIPKTVEDCFNRFYPDHMEALIACIEAIE